MIRSRRQSQGLSPSLTHSLTHLLTYSLTHLLTHSRSLSLSLSLSLSFASFLSITCFQNYVGHSFRRRYNVGLFPQPVDICETILGVPRGASITIATALHMASITGDAGVCQILVGAGADLEAYTDGCVRKTPLHLAIERLHVHVVELLTEAGADVNTPATLTKLDDDRSFPFRLYNLSPLQLVRGIFCTRET